MMSAVTSTAGAEPPAATRVGRPTWRDPRLWVGVALVAGSVLAGARLLAHADDSVSVWAARADLGAGRVLAADDLTVREVRFVDPDDQQVYLLADQPFPTDLRLARDLGAGELVARSALGAAGDPDLLTVPLAVPALAVPPDVAAGARVDVWVTTEDAEGGSVARPLLTDVLVVAAPTRSDAFGSSGDRQLVLGVDRAQERQLGRTLAAVGDQAITVVGRG